MKRIFSFVTIALVTLILLSLLFDIEPLPSTPLGPTERPRKLTPAEQRDSVTPGRQVGKG